jgi:hypothetical protein
MTPLERWHEDGKRKQCAQWWIVAVDIIFAGTYIIRNPKMMMEE